MNRTCKTCRVVFEADPLAPRPQCRCSGCQVTFEAWLQGDSPVTYQPRRDGVWRDVARPVR